MDTPSLLPVRRRRLGWCTLDALTPYGVYTL
jgi:hypothetical protein